MGELVKLVVGLLTGAAGEQVGGAVSKASQWIAVLTFVGGAFLWLHEHGGEEAVRYTYSQLAGFAIVLGVVLFVVVRLVHRAPPPG